MTSDHSRPHPGRTPAIDPESPPIQLDDLRYQVDSKVVLDGVNLTVHRGEIVAIMGRTGCGKTTLLRLVIGLVRPTSGAVRIHGIDLSSLSERQLDELRTGMGLVFQGAALFDSMTVFDNVAFALVEHRRMDRREVAGRVEELLKMVDMAGSEGLMPAQLSGGMRKRVAVARALALQPSIMLYDEPTAGLDPISAAALDDLIRSLRDRLGVTSLVVSHDLDSLRRISDRAALLHGGRFLAVGPMAQLQRDSNPAVRQFLAGSPDGPLTEGTRY
jgi:phospholipid/cholesterol/gamma-HCH transport system ATP-binding protein